MGKVLPYVECVCVCVHAMRMRALSRPEQVLINNVFCWPLVLRAELWCGYGAMAPAHMSCNIIYARTYWCIGCNCPRMSTVCVCDDGTWFCGPDWTRRVDSIGAILFDFTPRSCAICEECTCSHIDYNTLITGFLSVLLKESEILNSIMHHLTQSSIGTKAVNAYRLSF